MIEEINIQDLGVIKQASIIPSSNMTVITGETGAGKTMLLTSLKMILGEKTHSAVVRNGSEYSYVEAIIDLKQNPIVCDYMKNKEYDFDESEIIFARKISINKNSRSYIDGKTFPSSVLKDIGSKIITIHGQQDQMRLKTVQAQRQAIDEYGDVNHQNKIKEYENAYIRIKKLQNDYKKIQENAQTISLESEAYNSIIKKFDQLQIQPDEDKALKEEIDKNIRQVEIIKNLQTVNQMLSNDETNQGIIEILQECKSLIENLSAEDENVKQILKQICSTQMELKDVNYSINRIISETSVSYEEMEENNKRYDKICKLMKNRARNTAQLYEWIENAREKYADYENIDLKLKTLLENIKKAKDDLIDKGKKLELSRKKIAKEFSENVTKQIRTLNMKDANFEVKFIDLPKPTSYGLSEITMTFTSHPNIKPQSISEGVSGGELSRIMLGIEVVLASKNQKDRQTFVFDEVDSGIGGETALQVGNRLKELSKTHQVIVVTHLPQVAAYGDVHYVVGKNKDITTVKQVKDSERVIEIARMLSVQKDLRAAKEHAQELLQTLSTK